MLCSQINTIIKAVKRRRTTKKMTRTADVRVAVAVAIYKGTETDT
jgi:hypothetical protein